jgi:hypothetical protein
MSSKKKGLIAGIIGAIAAVGYAIARHIKASKEFRKFVEPNEAYRADKGSQSPAAKSSEGGESNG